MKRSSRRASRPPKPTSFSSQTLPPPHERSFSNHHTLLYTPNNEHVGIGPVNSVRVAHHRMQFWRTKRFDYRQTGKSPDRLASFSAGLSLVRRDEGSCSERIALANRAKRRIDENFTLEKMTNGLEVGIKQVFKVPRLSF